MCRYCLNYHNAYDQELGFALHAEAKKLNQAIREFEKKAMAFEGALNSTHNPKERQEASAFHKAIVRARRDFNRFYNDKFLMGCFDYQKGTWKDG